MLDNILALYVILILYSFFDFTDLTFVNYIILDSVLEWYLDIEIGLPPKACLKQVDEVRLKGTARFDFT